MSATMLSPRSQAQAELARRELERRKARADPLYLVSFMSAADENDGTYFGFEHCRFPLAPGEVPVHGHTLGAQTSWRWQRYAGELILNEDRLVILKGRQIGVTWLYLAVDVAEAILNPGTSSLIYRQREEDAIDNARRWWILYQSLPEWWKAGIKVLRPTNAPEPGRDGVALRFVDLPSKPISRITPMTSASSSGHGRTVRRILMDEAAHVELLGQIRKAVEPAAGRSKIGYVSTAKGRFNETTQGGNEFHRLWVGAEEFGFRKLFLPYNVHPLRNQDWYDNNPSVRSLKVHERQEQYPADEHEAFALTNTVFFDPEDLMAYRQLIRQPTRRYDFRRRSSHSAQLQESARGMTLEFQPPVYAIIGREGVLEEAHRYAIGADPATGRAQDMSSAFVLDLADMSIVAEFHGRLDADEFAYQLHYLGKRYLNALIAVESTGGYGEAVMIPLRDGREGRPAYSWLYRHVLSARPDMPVSKPFGFPTNSKTRPQILNHVERVLRERTLPWVTDGLLGEMENFVRHETGTSPRAAEGYHDDRVLAFAIALELFRQRGEHPERYQVKKSRKPKPHWLDRRTVAA